jgi:hypothetical protein
MKRIFSAILASLFIVAPVSAADNTVYIREADGKVVYEASDGFNERFMFHEDMVPGGDAYTDYLTIENGTSNSYDIFFKITAENNSIKASNLIEHIEMKVYIDDVLFYDGKARGLDYRAQGVNLTDAVKIKNFASGESVHMKVETRLDSTYEDINNPDTSKTQWHFYATGEEPDPEKPVEPEEIPPVPKTSDDFTPWFFALLGGSVVLFIIVTIFERANKNKRARA